MLSEYLFRDLRDISDEANVFPVSAESLYNIER